MRLSTSTLPFDSALPATAASGFFAPAAGGPEAPAGPASFGALLQARTAVTPEGAAPATDATVLPAGPAPVWSAGPAITGAGGFTPGADTAPAIAAGLVTMVPLEGSSVRVAGVGVAATDPGTAITVVPAQEAELGDVSPLPTDARRPAGRSPVGRQAEEDAVAGSVAALMAQLAPTQSPALVDVEVAIDGTPVGSTLSLAGGGTPTACAASLAGRAIEASGRGAVFAPADQSPAGKTVATAEAHAGGATRGLTDQDGTAVPAANLSGAGSSAVVTTVGVGPKTAVTLPANAAATVAQSSVVAAKPAIAGQRTTRGADGDEVPASANARGGPVAASTTPAIAAGATAVAAPQASGNAAPEQSNAPRATVSFPATAGFPKTAGADPLPGAQAPSDNSASNPAPASAPDAATATGISVVIGDASPAGAIRKGVPAPVRGLQVSAGSVAEKIAAQSGRFENGGHNAPSGQQKRALTSYSEDVTGSSKGLGTDTAKSDAPMPAPAPSASSPSRPSESVPFSAMPLAMDALATDAGTGASSELARAATRAVDAALAMSEHFSSGDQRGVSLKFSVSGVDLSVRVEMRADGVHTFFRTDSPELRGALAQEWQKVVTAQPEDRSQRLADPVFTSSAHGSGTAMSSDAGAGQYRGARQQPEPGTAAERLAAPAPRASTSATTVAAPKAPATRPIPLSTVRHLHTFA